MTEVARGSLQVADTVFEWGKRTYVMGILNLTPDSFSGDGLGTDLERTLTQARAFLPEADLLDLGAESTRPQSTPVTLEEELARLLPALTAIKAVGQCPISVDTSKPLVARQALAAGAHIINDVTGLADPAMRELVAESGCPAIVMHMRGTPRTMMNLTNYGGNVVGVLLDWFALKLEQLQAAGIRREQIIIDPGIGFAKTFEQNLEILHRLSEFRVLGQPLLIGLSRKAFIGQLLAVNGQPSPVGAARDYGTASALALAIAGGADIVRIHNVPSLAGAIRVADAIARY